MTTNEPLYTLTEPKHIQVPETHTICISHMKLLSMFMQSKAENFNRISLEKLRQLRNNYAGFVTNMSFSLQ